MKQVENELVTLTVRVQKPTADRLRVVAQGNYRPVAAELRKLIEDHVADPEDVAA